MDFLCEIYDAKGARLDYMRFDDPMLALAWVAAKSTLHLGFEFVTATCYHKGVPQWELEIK